MTLAANSMNQPRAEEKGTLAAQAHASPSDEASVRPPARVEQLFAELDDLGMRWCLLRPAGMLAQAKGDIDLLVEPSSLERVRALLADQQFVAVPVRGGDLHMVDYDRDDDRFLWLHVQTGVRLGSEALTADAVLDTVERVPLPQPNRAWLLWLLVLHDILDKGEIPERHRPELARLALDAGIATAAPLCAIAQRQGLEPDATIAMVRAGQWAQLGALARGHAAPASAPWERVLAAVGRVAHAWRGRRPSVAVSWRRRGLSVAIIGPDGAGKTTLVNGLRTALPFPTYVMYMGLTGGRLPRADALRVPGVVLAARLALLWTRYAVGLLHRARGRVVIYERYALDGLVPSGAPLRPLARLSRRVQALAVPRPGLVLLLDASGAVMHARKGEYDPLQLEQWRGAYRRLLGRSGRVEILDAEQPPDAVRRDAQACIWRCLAERWQQA